MTRRAFTTLETLVAVSLFMMVMGISLTLWTGAFKDFFKGEDALTSVQDASLVLLHLRRDLLELTLPADGRPYDLRFVRIRGQHFVTDDLRFDPPTRAFVKRHKETDDPEVVYAEDKTELAFFVNDATGDRFVPVTYVYFPGRQLIQRRVGRDRPRDFALPRLEDFELQLEAEDRFTELLPIRLLGTRGEGTDVLRRIWFHVRFAIKAQRTKNGIETTRVDVETKVFPKALNRRIRSAWRSGS